MGTVDFITALFDEVDEPRRALPQPPAARRGPSAGGTLGLLHALTGGGTRPLYCGLTRA